MNWNNDLSKMLSLAFPVIQAPMLGITTPAMVAAAANAGMLGSLPLGGLSPERCRQLIQATKALTPKPFAVNLFIYDIPPCPPPEETEGMRKVLQQMAASAGFTYNDLPDAAFRHYDYKEQLELLKQEQIAIVSFTFGMPDKESAAFFKDNRMLLIGTATSVDEAIALHQNGTDLIVTQGIEAGGHRGSFLDKEHLPQVGSLSLIPQVAASVPCPVIAAGGIRDGRSLSAAMMLGAQGVQIGSALLASHESSAIAAYKKLLQTAKATDSVLTRAFSGRWARGLRNKFIETIAEGAYSVPEYPWQNSLSSAFKAAAQQQDNGEYTNLWAGQSAGGAEDLPTEAILMRIIREAEAL